MHYSEKLNTAVDNLFTEILGSKGDRLDYHQAKIEFMVTKLEKQPELLDYKMYKVNIAQSLIDLYRHDFSKALRNLKRAEDFLEGHSMERPYATAHTKVSLSIQKHTKRHERKQKRVDARRSAISALLGSIGTLALGGVITWIAYSITAPGGTYLVTTGLFLSGGIYFCVAVYKLIKWGVLAAVTIRPGSGKLKL